MTISEKCERLIANLPADTLYYISQFLTFGEQLKFAITKIYRDGGAPPLDHSIASIYMHPIEGQFSEVTQRQGGEFFLTVCLEAQARHFFCSLYGRKYSHEEECRSWTRRWWQYNQLLFKTSQEAFFYEFRNLLAAKHCHHLVLSMMAALKSFGEINFQFGPRQETLLHCLGESQQSIILFKFAVEKLGASPNIQNSLGDTSVHLRCRTIKHNLTPLITPRDDLNVRNNRGDSPLTQMVVTPWGSDAYSQLLFTYKRNLEEKNLVDSLFLAIQRRNNNALITLIVSGVDYRLPEKKSGMTPLEYSFSINNPGAFKILQAHYANNKSVIECLMYFFAMMFSFSLFALGIIFAVVISKISWGAVFFIATPFFIYAALLAVIIQNNHNFYYGHYFCPCYSIIKKYFMQCPDPGPDQGDAANDVKVGQVLGKEDGHMILFDLKSMQPLEP